MELATNIENDVYERARLSRDARFDGRFFIGVKTTGIYCRPICPANIPKSENVNFFPSAAAASEAGFRPCLRCRPECAPGTPAWAGTSTTVQRGLRLIAEGALESAKVALALAALRTTFGGVNDGELLEYAREGNFTWRVPEDALERFPEGVAAAFRRLQALQKRIRRLPVERQIHAALLEGDFALLQASYFEGAQRIANVRKLAERGWL